MLIDTNRRRLWDSLCLCMRHAGIACLMQLRHCLESCFSVVFGKKVVHHTNTNYINLPLFLSESSLYRWPVFATTKPIGPGVAANPMMAMMMSNPMMAMMMGGSGQSCWWVLVHREPVSQQGNAWHKWVLSSLIWFGFTPHPATSRIITSLVGNPYKPWFATVTGCGHWDWQDRCRHGSCGRGSEGTKKERNWFAWGPRG